MKPPRLVIVTTHPIQYQVPFFRALSEDSRIDLHVLFLNLPDRCQQGVGFGQPFKWDVPLLTGYRWSLAPSATGSIDSGWWGLRLSSASKDLAELRPDLVMVTGWQKRGMLQCLLVARKLGIATIIRAESNGLAPLSFPRRIRNCWILGKADRLLPIGEANRHFYQRLGFGGRIGQTAPYCVDNGFFAEGANPLRAKALELRGRWGVPESARCFLFAGKLVSKKRPQDLAAAIERLSRRMPGQVHLLVVGSGPLQKELEAQAMARHLPITFAGFLNQTEMPSAYAAADCLVLPSDYGETWGLVVNEAMACGLPAIVSDRVGCGPDLVTDGETGFQFRFGDIEGLAAGLAKFAALNDSERRAMGERARARVFTDYSIQRAVENTVAETLRLAEAHRAEVCH